MTPEELKAWRGRMGLSQKAAAEELNVSVATFSDWERGKSRDTGKYIGPTRLVELATIALESAAKARRSEE